MGALPLAICSKRAARMVENFPLICAMARVNERRLPSPLCRPTAPSRPTVDASMELPSLPMTVSEMSPVSGKFVFDQLTRLKENCSLLERDLSQVWFEKRKCIGGHGRQQAVVPKGLGRRVDQNSLLSSSDVQRWKNIPARLRKVYRLPFCVGCGGLLGVRAGSYPCGGETASDDVPVSDDFPVPVAGRTVRRDTIRKGAFSSHDTPSLEIRRRGGP
jgi:hypothetical protein